MILFWKRSQNMYLLLCCVGELLELADNILFHRWFRTKTWRLPPPPPSCITDGVNGPLTLGGFKKFTVLVQKMCLHHCLTTRTIWFCLTFWMYSLARLNWSLCLKSLYGLLIIKAEIIMYCKYLLGKRFLLYICHWIIWSKSERQFLEQSFAALK